MSVNEIDSIKYGPCSVIFLIPIPRYLSTSAHCTNENTNFLEHARDTRAKGARRGKEKGGGMIQREEEGEE